MKQKILLSAFLFIVSFQTLSQPGAPDPAFGTSGWAYYTGEDRESGFNHMAIQPDGKIIVHRRGYLGRYNTNGTLDNSFGTDGWKRLDHGLVDIAIQADGSILVLASNESIGRIFKHKASDGAIDNTWGNEGIVTIELPAVALRYNSIVLDSRGRIIVAGRATFGTDPIFRVPSVARLNADGSLDAEFNGIGIRNTLFLDFLSRGAIECAVDGSDKIVISVGVAGEVNDIILKYNTNGRLDLGFGGGDGELDLYHDIDRLAVNADGKIAYTTQGEFDQATLDFYYYYLNADGSYINDGYIFNITGLTEVTFQPDGKFVVAGHYLSNLFFIRHNTDGSVDQSFLNDDMDIDDNIIPKEIVYFNRRLFVAGFYPVRYFQGVVSTADAFILALDATDKRLKCNTFPAGVLQPNADSGTCYKTINDTRFDPGFIPSTATGTVNYKLLRNGIVVEQGTGSVNGKNFQVGATQVIYSYTDITTHSCTFTVTVLDKQLPVPKVKNITAQLNSLGNVSIAAADVNDGSTDNCGIKSMLLSKTSFDCSNVGANTVTFTVIDNSNNTSTTNAIVTVEDKVVPVASCKNVSVALDSSGNVSITAAQVDDVSTDACGIKSLSLSKTVFDCSNKGSNQVTLTVTDNNDNSSECIANVTVSDNISPSIVSITPNPAFLWPADRKMKSVTINAALWDNCPGATYSITNVVVTAGEFAGDNIGPDWEITGPHTVNLRAEIPKKGVKRVYTLTITCIDAAGNSTTGTVDIMVTNTITQPAPVTQSGNNIMESQQVDPMESLELKTYPNPAISYFNILINSTNLKEKIGLQVFDQYGRLIETRNSISNGSTVCLGDLYRPGVYYVRVMQGKQHKEMKLIKLSD